MFKSLSLVMTASIVAGCAASPSVPDAARAELAPTGKLRGGMNVGNTLLMAKDKATGKISGVSVDLMNELGKRLGVPVEFVVHATPGDVADAVDKNTWDVAILAIAEARAKTIAFSPPISAIDATYVVAGDSPLRSAGEADAAGVRIAAPNKAGYELYLTQTLRHATLVRTKSFQESIDAFNEKRVDAVAALKPNLIDAMHKMPGGRMLEGTFMTVGHGLSTPRTRQAAAAYLKTFAEEMNASGFVARSIARHGIKGLSAVK